MATKSVANPCTKDCARRTVYCKLSCPDVAVYNEFKRQQYAERAAAVDAYGAFRETRYSNVKRFIR